MHQYEMCELSFSGPVCGHSNAAIDMKVHFSCPQEKFTVKGFYAETGCYKARFLPQFSGEYAYSVTGCIIADGTVRIEPARDHGPVRAEGTHFVHADGTSYCPFGTTAYGILLQTECEFQQSLRALQSSPFNKLRCQFFAVYGKSKVDIQHPFALLSNGHWDVNHPNLPYWDQIEDRLACLGALGIQVDLILFHPYGHFRMDSLSSKEIRGYLDYMLRRLGAYPFLWWSLANEYDLCSPGITASGFRRIERFMAAGDPFHHLLSVHNYGHFWNFKRKNITHASIQSYHLSQVGAWLEAYQKPVIVDECGYEGNHSLEWGCLSGRKMADSFWKVVVSGGYCTHGETFVQQSGEPRSLQNAYLGESPDRIRFLRDLLESLPAALEPIPEPFDRVLKMPTFLLKGAAVFVGRENAGIMKATSRMNAHERTIWGDLRKTYAGHGGDWVYLYYLADRCYGEYSLLLPKEHIYRVEVIDTWDMTRETVLENAAGNTRVALPGKPGMAILAIRL